MPYSPELNPVEQIWQQLRKSHFSNRCFAGYEEIMEVYCQAWNAFTERPEVIQSLCSREWATLESELIWIGMTLHISTK